MNSEPGRHKRRVVVTGALGGIGQVLCKTLVDRGDVIVLASDREKDAPSTITPNSSDRLSLFPADVTDPRSVEALANAVTAGGPIHGLVNLAGTEGQISAPLHEIPSEEFRHVIDVNLVGTFEVCRVLLPALLETGGALVNVASVAGLVAFRHKASYVASKHGVIGLTRSLALDYAAQGIRANCLCPGPVAGPMMDRVEQTVDNQGEGGASTRLRGSIPTGRYCAPYEVAEAVAWLLLDAPRSITGSVLTIDGGWTIK